MNKKHIEMVRDFGYIEGILWGIPVDVDAKTLDDIMTQLWFETKDGPAGYQIFEQWMSQGVDDYDGSEACGIWSAHVSKMQQKFGITKLKQIARKVSKARLKASTS